MWQVNHNELISHFIKWRAWSKNPGSSWGNSGSKLLYVRFLWIQEIRRFLSTLCLEGKYWPTGKKLSLVCWDSALTTSDFCVVFIYIHAAFEAHNLRTNMMKPNPKTCVHAKLKSFIPPFVSVANTEICQIHEELYHPPADNEFLGVVSCVHCPALCVYCQPIGKFLASC